MTKKDLSELLLTAISFFLGVAGIAGLITVLSQGTEVLTTLGGIISFSLFALFIAVSISILKQLFD